MASKNAPPAQPGLPMVQASGLTNTMDPSVAIQHTVQQQQHEDRLRVADAARIAEVAARAAAEVGSWSTDPVPSKPAAPQPTSPQPDVQTGPRTPVSFDPQNADEMWRYAQMMARSSLLPRAFYDRDDRERKHAKIADVHFVLMKGQALRLHPMVSIGNINVIDGKAEVGASLMVALCLRDGLCEYFEMVKSDERSATFATKRIGGRREIEFTYTIEEAEQMGLLDKGKTEWAQANNQWKKQPRTMLRRRCQSMLAREVYPDIVMGLYDHGELSEMREREMALGIDPDRVIPMNGLAGAGVSALLPEGAGPGAIEKLFEQSPDLKRAYAADPLKARLAARQQASKIAVGPQRCSLCDVILDPRDSDPCIACRPEPSTAA